MRCLKVLAVLLLAVPAAADFNAAGFNPRGAAMGGAMTAVPDDLSAMQSNPGNLGSIGRLQTGLNYLRQFHVPGGKTNTDTIAVGAGIPVRQEIFNGTFGVSLLYDRIKDQATERVTSLGYGTRGLIEREEGGIDFGAAVKVLSRSAGTVGSSAKPTVDLGMSYRFWEKYNAGLSILNFSRPKLPGGRAPLTLKLGVSENVRGLTMALDFTKAEPGDFGPVTAVAAGLERWWATARHGSFAGRTGLNLGDRDKTWRWGLGWRIMGGEINYAMTVPMQGATMIGHAVGLLFRFGQSNPEGEYERMLASELKYRQDLIGVLEAGEMKQWKLSQELTGLRDEIEILRRQLLEKTLSEAEAKRRLAALQERHQRANEEHQRLIDEQRRLKAKTKQDFFREDWAAYEKAKAAGSPDSVLSDQLRRILREYKDSGVDLSQANQELLRLLRSQ
jgi:hypothetical protein